MSENPEKPKVGYKNPPKANQFKPNQSGNPKGRPKGSKNLSTEIETELNARASITQNGKRRNVPMKKLIAKQLVGKAAKGEDKSIGTLLNYERQRESGAEGKASQAVFTAEDRMTMAGIWQRIQRREPSPDLSSPAEPSSPADPGDLQPETTGEQL